MALKIPNTKGLVYPLKLLIEGNSDAHSQLYSVIGSLEDKNLTYKHPSVKNRTIAEMISHALCTQSCFYTSVLVLGNKEGCNPECRVPKSVPEALKRIQTNLNNVTRKWSKLSEVDLGKEIKTEWGQVMTEEIALFQSIEHMMYHVGEICFLAGIGGFYKGVLG